MYVLKFRLDSTCMLVSHGSTQACQSPIGNVSYQLSMSVSNGSPIRHVGIR